MNPNMIDEGRSSWLSPRLLWFIVAIYPLVVIPNTVVFDFTVGNNVFTLPPSYFYAPRYLLLAMFFGEKRNC